MFRFNKKRIYLDFASITPIDSRVQKVLTKSHRFFANPSALYKEGVLAKKQIEQARTNISSLLGVSKKEIYFTSGGTEGNNLAILGAFHQAKKVLKENLHMIVSSIEHSSVLECALYLEKEEGVKVTYVAPKEDGIIDPKAIRELIEPNTFLVSVQMVNNEIGVIEPITLIAKSIRHFKKHSIQADNQKMYPLFHTDACQALNYLEINTTKLGVDLMTFDGTKIYGPRGIGVLYKKNSVTIDPVVFGGGQEEGLRSGTENTPAIVGISKAFSLCNTLRQKETLRLKKLQEYFLVKLTKQIPEAVLNGSLESRVVNNVNFCIRGVDAEFLVFQFDAHGVALSSASSCLSKKEDSYSYVVKAIKPKEGCEGSSVRVSFGRTTTKSHIDRFFAVYKKVSQIKL
jgi:cysteine desulfurase